MTNPATHEQQITVSHMVKDRTQQFHDGLISFGEWHQFLLQDLCKPEMFAAWDAEQNVEPSEDTRTVVVIRHHKDTTAEQLGELLCKTVHELDPDALAQLAHVTYSFDSPDCLSD